MAGEVKQGPLTCNPKVDTTLTEAVWTQRAKEGGWFLQVDEGSTDADYLGVTFMANNAKNTVGRLVSVSGTGDTFKVGVEPAGQRGYAQGGDTGSFASTDWGDRMKANTNGKLVVDNSATDGNIHLVGGDKADPVVAWVFPYN